MTVPSWLLLTDVRKLKTIALQCLPVALALYHVASKSASWKVHMERHRQTDRNAWRRKLISFFVQKRNYAKPNTHAWFIYHSSNALLIWLSQGIGYWSRQWDQTTKNWLARGGNTKSMKDGMGGILSTHERNQKHIYYFNPLTLRWLMSYIYGAPILDVSRSHTTAQHSR